jgi:ABC-type glutathione transport system ATPase component
LTETSPVIELVDLRIAFGRPGTRRSEVVHGISLSVGAGEIVAIVGESGSGKSVTALSILQLLPKRRAEVTGLIRFGAADLLKAGETELRRIRGDRIGMIFQEPMTSLNPVLSIGRQLTEGLVAHRGLSGPEARSEALAMLERVGMPGGVNLLRRYPHEFSGGMRQRVMIAAAMVMRPALLIADEPTTALDVTVQAQILDLMRALVRETGTSLIFITHDMGVVAEIADRVVVMRGGRIVETDSATQLFASPSMPYTRALLAAVPRIDAAVAAGAPAQPRGGPPALEVRGLTKTFGGQAGRSRVLDGVDLDIAAGEVVALVGESGSGKSTAARAIARLIDIDAGTIRVDGEDFGALTGAALRSARRRVQMIFQDPYASLDPRFTVGRTVAEPMIIAGGERRRSASEKARALIRAVGLDEALADRYPHQLSGGQRQRVVIARALAAEPRIIVADEPTSALDVSIQAQILELFREIRAARDLAMLFISHDLAVVRRIADRVAVMRAGRLLEFGPTEAVLNAPLHPYTRALISAVPLADPTRRGRPRIEAAPGSYPVGPLVEMAPRHLAAS